ncbi:hypothetical protein SEVIR_3G135101v4 [Setaria viridis]|uniref:Uncharacterized protein n=1 Tax=Setaria viridis TaxID=4556 RepID=A0A4U6VB52_SETVI|nr:hypothetical protein SEVIR_3G135101v2 [Setaria viridis]
MAALRSTRRASACLRHGGEAQLPRAPESEARASISSVTGLLPRQLQTWRVEPTRGIADRAASTRPTSSRTSKLHTEPAASLKAKTRRWQASSYARRRSPPKPSGVDADLREKVAVA